jgi:hypothetical protein
MNPFNNALRVITRRYLDDFHYGEERFETEDGAIPFESEDRDGSTDRDEGDETELKEAA